MAKQLSVDEDSGRNEVINTALGNRRNRLQKKIFISYRREDSSGHVGRLYDRLAGRFGKSRVLRDIDSIPFGADFEKLLEGHLHESSVCVVVIGDKWMSLLRDRQATPRDYVRFEVGRALKMDCLVIPVLIGNAQMPKQDELKDFPDILPITRRNALTMREDINFESDFLRLLNAIEPRYSPKRKALAVLWGCLLFMLLGGGYYAITTLVSPVEAASEYHTEDEIGSRDLPIPTDNVERRIPDLVIGGLRFIWIDPSDETPFFDQSKFKELRRELNNLGTTKSAQTEGFYLQRDQYSKKDSRFPLDASMTDHRELMDDFELQNLSSADQEVSRISKAYQDFLFRDSQPATLEFRLPTISEWRFAASDILLARTRGINAVQSDFGFSGFFSGLPEIVASDETSLEYRVCGFDAKLTTQSSVASVSEYKTSLLSGLDIRKFIAEGDPSPNSEFTDRVGMRLLLPGGGTLRSSTVYTNNKTDEELLIVAYKSGNEGRKLEDFAKKWSVSPGRENRLEFKKLGLNGWYWIVIYSRVVKSEKTLTIGERVFRERVSGWCHFGYLDFSILEVENHGENLRFDSVLFR